MRIAPVGVIAEVEIRSVFNPKFELTGAWNRNAHGHWLVARLHASSGHFLAVRQKHELAIARDSSRRVERENRGKLLDRSIELVRERRS